jgi:hypothetical protein
MEINLRSLRSYSKYLTTRHRHNGTRSSRPKCQATGDVYSAAATAFLSHWTLATELPAADAHPCRTVTAEVEITRDDKWKSATILLTSPSNGWQRQAELFRLPSRDGTDSSRALRCSAAAHTTPFHRPKRGGNHRRTPKFTDARANKRLEPLPNRSSRPGYRGCSIPKRSSSSRTSDAAENSAPITCLSKLV